MGAQWFSQDQLQVIQWAAEECTRQRSGELSVWWMLEAWDYAMEAARRGPPTPPHVLHLAKFVEPTKNANGYRRVGVRVGANVKVPWQQVPQLMEELFLDHEAMTPEEWYRCYEEIHPFVDGNGRTGTILYCWLRERLSNPVHPPDWDHPVSYWADGSSVEGLSFTGCEQWARSIRSGPGDEHVRRSP